MKKSKSALLAVAATLTFVLVMNSYSFSEERKLSPTAWSIVLKYTGLNNAKDNRETFLGDHTGEAQGEHEVPDGNQKLSKIREHLQDNLNTHAHNYPYASKEIPEMAEMILARMQTGLSNGAIAAVAHYIRPDMAKELQNVLLRRGALGSQRSMREIQRFLKSEAKGGQSYLYGESEIPRISKLIYEHLRDYSYPGGNKGHKQYDKQYEISELGPNKLSWGAWAAITEYNRPDLWAGIYGKYFLSADDNNVALNSEGKVTAESGLRKIEKDLGTFRQLKGQDYPFLPREIPEMAKEIYRRLEIGISSRGLQRLDLYTKPAVLEVLSKKLPSGAPREKGLEEIKRGLREVHHHNAVEAGRIVQVIRQKLELYEREIADSSRRKSDQYFQNLEAELSPAARKTLSSYTEPSYLNRMREIFTARKSKNKTQELREKTFQEMESHFVAIDGHNPAEARKMKEVLINKVEQYEKELSKEKKTVKAENSGENVAKKGKELYKARGEFSTAAQRVIGMYVDSYFVRMLSDIFIEEGKKKENLASIRKSLRSLSANLEEKERFQDSEIRSMAVHIYHELIKHSAGGRNISQYAASLGDESSIDRYLQSAQDNGRISLDKEPFLAAIVHNRIQQHLRRQRAVAGEEAVLSNGEANKKVRQVAVPVSSENNPENRETKGGVIDSALKDGGSAEIDLGSTSDCEVGIWGESLCVVIGVGEWIWSKFSR